MLTAYDSVLALNSSQGVAAAPVASSPRSNADCRYAGAPHHRHPTKQRVDHYVGRRR